VDPGSACCAATERAAASGGSGSHAVEGQPAPVVGRPRHGSAAAVTAAGSTTRSAGTSASSSPSSSPWKMHGTPAQRQLHGRRDPRTRLAAEPRREARLVVVPQRPRRPRAGRLEHRLDLADAARPLGRVPGREQEVEHEGQVLRLVADVREQRLGMLEVGLADDDRAVLVERAADRTQVLARARVVVEVARVRRSPTIRAGRRGSCGPAR
jgi:hypothetical protein